MAEPAPPISELVTAVHEAIATEPGGRERDALSAFLGAWHRRWPKSFATAFGATAGPVVAWAGATAIDPDRYLKLSRIARAHLAQML